MSIRDVPSTPSPSLDPIDDQIIALLTENGRLAASDIAPRVDLSPDAVRERIKRLLDSGTVKVTGSVTPGSVGMAALALVALRVQGPVMPIAQRLATVELIDFVVCTTGPYDLLVEVLGTDQEQLLESIDRDIRGIAEVTHVEVFLYLSVEKSRIPAPRPDEVAAARSLDADELAIIDALRQDGRLSYKALATKTGINYPTARRKAIALLESGVVTIHTQVNQEVVSNQVDAAVGVSVRGPVTETIAYFRDLPEVDVMVTCTGRYDLLLDVITASMADLKSLVMTIRSAPGVTSTETLSYMSVLKVPYDWAMPMRP